MKLIPNFKQLLDNEELPEEFSDWWEFDDADALFRQEYKAQYRESAHHRFPDQKRNHLDTYYLPGEIKKIQTNLGCRRSKPTRRQVELQKMFYQQYDLALIEALCPLHTQVFKLALCREEIAQLRRRFRSLVTVITMGLKV